MEVSRLLPQYIPLVDPQPLPDRPLAPSSDASLLVMSPQEIQRNLEQWRELKERIHVVV